LVVITFCLAAAPASVPGSGYGLAARTFCQPVPLAIRMCRQTGLAVFTGIDLIWIVFARLKTPGTIKRP
jgi:hypothetical protein